MIDLFREQTHTSGQYELELKAFFERLLQMSFLIEEIVCTVLDSFLDKLLEPDELKRFSRKKEKKINRMELEIDQMVRDIYTRRAPVASDFRLMSSAARITTDLERIGDEAKNIAAKVHQIISSKYGAETKGSLRRLIDEVKAMIHETSVCLSKLDSTAARKIIKNDRIINECYDTIYGEMIGQISRNPEQIVVILDVIWCAHSMERIGDHCRNIAESVIFAVQGVDVRHPAKKKGKKLDKSNKKTSEKQDVNPSD